jgi:hypothetical protein
MFRISIDFILTTVNTNFMEVRNEKEGDLIFKLMLHLVSGEHSMFVRYTICIACS